VQIAGDPAVERGGMENERARVPSRGAFRRANAQVPKSPTPDSAEAVQCGRPVGTRPGPEQVAGTRGAWRGRSAVLREHHGRLLDREEVATRVAPGASPPVGSGARSVACTAFSALAGGGSRVQSKARAGVGSADIVAWGRGAGGGQLAESTISTR
ncbi:MAG: hypothetical protein QGH59_02830, partial [Gemmatimonadota bacterium]|nr:hypothetical protein [Gemmatimonadota bacterium]